MIAWGWPTTQKEHTPDAVEGGESEDYLRDIGGSIGFNEAKDLWEEMEALEVSGDISGEERESGVQERFQVQGKR